MFEFNYSVGDIKNSDLGEGIVCLGEGSGGKGGGKWGKGGGKWGKRGREVGIRGWGVPTPLSTPSDNMGPKRAQSFIRNFYIFMSFFKIENL